MPESTLPINAGFRRLADYLGFSYWFVPTVMAIAAVLLAGGMVALDTMVGSPWMDGYLRERVCH